MGWLNAVTGQALVIAGMGLAAGAAPAQQAPLRLGPLVSCGGDGWGGVPSDSQRVGEPMGR